MKKLISLGLLLAVSFWVLYLSGSVEEHHEAEYYFRDNDTLFSPVAIWFGVSCKKLGDQPEQFIEQGTIPEISGFDSFSSWLRYDESGLYELQYVWCNPDQEDYQELVLFLCPEFSEKYGKRVGAYKVERENCTVTERQGITIYGDGTMDTASRVLELTLKDGTYCQIWHRTLEGVPSDESLAAMEILVDFLLEHEIDLSDYIVLE